MLNIINMPKKLLRYDIQLPLTILKEGNRYVAYTPALDLSTSGQTAKKAKQRFSEALHLFLEELTESGHLDATLKSLGWSKINAKWQAPKIIEQATHRAVLPA